MTPGGASVAGRRRELGEIRRLLDRAARGAGGLLVISGPAGAGKSTIAGAAADEARCRGLRVLWVSPAEGQPGRLAWAQLLRDIAAPAGLTARLLGAGVAPLDLDDAARHLVSGPPALIVVDDIDRGGPDAVELLSVVGARCAAAPVAVIATASRPLGLREEIRLAGLSEDELAAALGAADKGGSLGNQAAHAVWLASGGLPGPAMQLRQELAGLSEHDDPVVFLALTARSAEPFLGIDTNLVRLLEAAVGRARDDKERARVLAKLARELLGDARAAGRRRELADEALALARRSGDPGVLAEVLDARLHALWDPEGAQDRLAAGSEIMDLARAAGDRGRERHGMFWRFVALMELGRVAEAESALAAFAREATAAGDAAAAVMVTGRRAMLAVLRGRFEHARQLVAEVRESAARAGLADGQAISMMLAALIAMELDPSEFDWQRAIDLTREAVGERPGHLFEAATARMYVYLGRHDQAAVELERLLPLALASSGPRWLGAMADLAFAAVSVGDASAAAKIYPAMAPYRGMLVVRGGANSAWGPVSHHLGLLAATMGRTADAIRDLREAIELEERIGALPFLAHSLAGLAGALARAGDGAQAAACRRRSREIAQRLGMSVLLKELGLPATEWALVRDGDDWLLTAGEEHARLRDARGLHYLRALLAAPGQRIRALDLAAGGAGLTPAGTGPVLDDTARKAYRQRLDAVSAALAAADRTGDRVAAQHAEAERQALLRELQGATGLAGRIRNAAPEAERARVNVTRTLQAAIDRIAAAAPVTAAHLKASVRTGSSCSYEPAPGGPDRWLV